MKIGEEVYQSNESRVLFRYESAAISMTSENEGEELKCGDEIDYTITIKNTGRTNSLDPIFSRISVHLTDFLPEGVEPISVTYDNWEQETHVDEETGVTEVTENFTKKEPVTESLEGMETKDEEDGKPVIYVQKCSRFNNKRRK